MLLREDSGASPLQTWSVTPTVPNKNTENPQDTGAIKRKVWKNNSLLKDFEF